MKKLTALAFIISGVAALHPAHAQQLPSTDDSKSALIEKRQVCQSNTYKPDTRIDACTLLIGSDQETTENHAKELTIRGNLYSKQSEHQKALQDYDQAIKLNPTFAPAWNGRCFLHAIVGELPAALKDCDESLRLAKDADTFDSRGFVYLKMKNPDAAITDYDAALALSPTLATAHYGRGLAERMKGARGAEARQAEADIEEGLGIAPETAANFTKWGILKAPKFSWQSWLPHSLWVWGLFGAAVFWVIIKLASRNRLSAEPKKLGRDREGYEEAQSGIPHAGFGWTNDGGFEVALKNKKSRYPGCLSAFKSYPDNHIKVTREAVIINGKYLRPNEFMGFEEGHYKFGQGYVEYAIAYTYGSQTSFLPGVWTQLEVSEIVLALNLKLRQFWKTEVNNSQQADPERLRNTRPTDF